MKLKLKHRRGAWNTPGPKTLFVLLLFILSIPLFAQRIYVKAGSTGDGSSWENALGDLQTALKKSVYGTEIWVAEGTYYPTRSADRTIAFRIPDGVKLYGGFRGNETTSVLRQPDQYPTILSGAIGTPSEEDNSYNVLYTQEAGSETEINGFFIMHGNATDWKAPQSSPRRSGGGWFHQSGRDNTSPVVKNCIFQNNTAIDGGAIYLNTNQSQSWFQLENCRFVENIAFSDGGAIYTDCRFNGNAKLHIRGCTFLRNESNNGGCIFNYAFNGRGEGIFLNCRFEGNRANARGSVVYNGSDFPRAFQVNNCQFIDNQAFEGGPIYRIGDYVHPKNASKKVKRI